MDLGATAKGVGSDRAVRAVMAVTGHAGGVLVSLGGDIAVGGTPPREGWPVTVAEEPGQAGSSPRSQLVRLASGAVATSSVSCGGGGAGARCCTTSWTRGPGGPRTGRGVR